MVCYLKFAGETRDAMASLYPTVEKARLTCALVAPAATVRDLNCNSLAAGQGAPVTVRCGSVGIPLGDPNRAGDGADAVFQWNNDRAI